MSNVYQYEDIWHPDVAVEILFLLNVVFGDIDYQFNDAIREEDSFALQDFELWDSEVDNNDLLLISSDFFYGRGCAWVLRRAGVVSLNYSLILYHSWYYSVDTIYYTRPKKI